MTCLSSTKLWLPNLRKDIVYPLGDINRRNHPELSRYSECSEVGGKEALTVLQVQNFLLENTFLLIQDIWYHPYV